MGVICPLCRAGGGWLPASHWENHVAASAVRTNTLAKYARMTAQILRLFLRFYALRHQFKFSLCPSAMMISVTVELTASDL